MHRDHSQSHTAQLTMKTSSRGFVVKEERESVIMTIAEEL